MIFLRWQLVLLLAAGGIVTAPSPATADESPVLEIIHIMFDGMAKRDGAAIRSAALPGATMVLLHDGKTEQLTFDAFAARISRGTTQIEEQIHDPVVHIDHDLAMVWAPFTFHLNGKFDHCGTDSFQLVHTNGRWLIASLAATVRRDCD